MVIKNTVEEIVFFILKGFIMVLLSLCKTSVN